MRARLSLLVALLAAVSCTACGSKNGDQVLAERAVLRSSDLPSHGEYGVLNWYSDDQTDDDLNETVIGSCVKLDFPGLVVTGDAHSDWFGSGSWQIMSFSVVYEDSPDQAFEELADHATQCIREERASSTGIAPLPVGDISITTMGEKRRGYAIKYRIGPLAVHDDVVLIQKSRTIALLWFSDVDKHVMVELSQAVASRM